MNQVCFILCFIIHSISQNAENKKTVAEVALKQSSKFILMEAFLVHVSCTTLFSLGKSGQDWL